MAVSQTAQLVEHKPSVVGHCIKKGGICPLKPIFHPKLINDPGGDPGIYINFLYERRAILFDCGELYSLSSRQLLKVSHIFISHTHMDHFIGFDHLLRLLLGRDKVLCVYGPSGIIDCLAHKLAAYSWNLVQNYTNHFEIRAYEVTDNQTQGAYFVCRDGFLRKPLDVRQFDGLLLDEPAFCVSAVILDHLLPSLAFCFKEKYHLNINKVRLAKLGLTPGPWLSELKEWVWQERDDREEFMVKCEAISRTFPFGVLRRELVSKSEGEKIVYVADAVYSQANAQKIIELAHGADYFFCEAAFMDKDKEQAKKTYHLTAGQAGELARQAKVKRFIPFHFSPRYCDNLEQVEQEAQNAFLSDN